MRQKIFIKVLAFTLTVEFTFEEAGFRMSPVKCLLSHLSFSGGKVRSVAVFTVFKLKLNFKLISPFVLGAAVVFSASAGYSFETPNWKTTPGVTCSSSDPDFKGYDYPEHVARCNRNVTIAMKFEIAKNYGDIPRAEWSNYEFDHLLPLCAGGSNSIGNIWPQPLEEAKKKDVIENEVCLGLRDGSITQAQALQKIHDWFEMMARQGSPMPDPLPQPQPSQQQQGDELDLDSD